MSTDRRKRRTQASHSRRKGSVLLVLIAMVLLLACLGAWWATSGSGADATPTPTIYAMLPQNIMTPSKPSPIAPDTPDIPIGTRVGQMAPDFRLKDLAGKEVALSDFRGRVVILNFWATWCGPCRAEIPAIRAVSERYEEHDLTVVAVNLGETSGAVSSFVKDFDMQFPVLLDTNISIARQYGVFSIPTTLFLDDQGVIREAHTGSMTQSYIEQVLAKLLPGS